MTLSTSRPQPIRKTGASGSNSNNLGTVVLLGDTDHLHIDYHVSALPHFQDIVVTVLRTELLHARHIISRRRTFR